jgi:tripartite-type tricarboxylate transporter receptor subunit TctC
MKSSGGEIMRKVGEARRGRLKIFLGAAPGVGKTYDMLRAAQSRRHNGVDVVVGLIETHGRQDTEEQLRGLEVIPRKRIEYKGHVFEEMDIDALLERGPGLYVSSWQAIWAPKNTPKAIIAKLDEAVMDSLGEPSVHRRLIDLAQEIPARDRQTPDALGVLQRSEIEKWWPIIKAAGIRVE